MLDYFKDYHPTINFIFFTFIIGFNMFILNPIIQGISLLAAIIYLFFLDKKIGLGTLGFFLFILIFFPILNGLFNNRGLTPIYYFRNGNALTLESIVYGFCSSLMFISMMVWFLCYNQIMTSDKFIYIFGDRFPSISILLTMILRFVPRYFEKLKEIYRGQKAIGEDLPDKGLIEKGKSGLKLVSMLTTWALENSIDTGDSMKARGYGLDIRRTSYSNYQYTRRDGLLLFYLVFLLGLILVGWFRGYFTMEFFPELVFPKLDKNSSLYFICFLIFSITPILLNILEEIKWQYLKLKI